MRERLRDSALSDTQPVSQGSLLKSVGLLMSTFVLLAMLSMLVSGVIARTTEGLAAAVNQSGSLRMQSYRIGMALADAGLATEERVARVTRLSDELEQRLASGRLVNAIPVQVGDAIRAGYDGIVLDWRERMRPALQDDLQRLLDTHPLRDPPLGPQAYLLGVDSFVERIDVLVAQLEVLTESRIAMMKTVLGVALVVTLVLALISMLQVRSRIIRPLAALLECADRTRRGDFSARTHYTGTDELGQVGAAINRMAEDLSCLYSDLAARVSEKTRDLQRTNQSLKLLYGVGHTLHECALSTPMLKRILQQIQARLNLRALTLCLQDDPETRQGRYQVTTRPDHEQRHVCTRSGCLACREAEPSHPFSVPTTKGGAQPLVMFRVNDQHQRFGVLIVDLDEGQTLADWQAQLLSSLAALLGSALSRHQRQGDARRLALYEERAVIARELHDSLAQALSYLKIQAARLDTLLTPQADPQDARPVLGELRNGISSAYRQLRELLNTFRLKVDKRGLAAALEATVDEFSRRGTTEIRLLNRLPALMLNPNEEIHVLQIVREALSNVLRHANATRVLLHLSGSDEGICVTVQDNGRGMDPDLKAAGHYGLQIMRERAASLGGTLTLTSGARGGTRVRLEFPHREQSVTRAPVD